MLSLGVDTSNYATSLAVVNTDSREVVCEIKRFLPVKDGGLGLRQSEALFHHVVALPALWQELCRQITDTQINQISTVGVSNKPRDAEGSYMPCFLAGYNFAVAFAAGRKAKLSTFSHQQGHVAAGLLGAGLPLTGQSYLFFHVSGGTTELLLTNGSLPVCVLGGTLDLFAGQAVDRLGVKLGFDFPAGVKVSALAQGCIQDISPKISAKDGYFHLSGLQNQCEKMLEENKDSDYVAKYCLCYIASCMKHSISVAKRAHPSLNVVCAGGVACSETIRQQLHKETANVHFAPAKLSADNAVGVALLAGMEAQNG